MKNEYEALDDSLYGIGVKEKVDLEFIQNSFSSKTLNYIVEENERELREESTNDISKLVDDVLSSGIKNAIDGKKIKAAVNEKREKALSESFQKIAEKIIEDAMMYEKEKQAYSRFTIEDLIISAKITKLYKNEESKEIPDFLKSVLPQESNLVSYSYNVEEKVEQLFDEQEAGMLSIAKMFEECFEGRDFQKTAIHAPNFESIIAYI